MKVSKSIRNVYNQSKGDYQRLSDEVCGKLRTKVEKKDWFFVHRLKELESFALKVETGRVSNPARMEDFFACTIVVPTVTQIADAEQMLKEVYEVNARKPLLDDTTHKRASDFVFDDLRMYLKRGSSQSGYNQDLEDTVFEVQIKTILQYAWGIASHDLIYKTDNVSWPKERIAFQVKAMLEHAEIAIGEAERLADSSAISKQDNDTTRTLEIIDVLRGFWPEERLPQNIKRLAESIRDILRTCNIKPDGLEVALHKEKKRIGILPFNLSPYSFLVQALAHNVQDFKAKIASDKNKRTRIVIHDDMDLPKWMKNEHKKIIRL